MEPLRTKLVHTVNAIFPSTKFLDLPEIKITLRSKKYTKPFLSYEMKFSVIFIVSSEKALEAETSAIYRLSISLLVLEI